MPNMDPRDGDQVIDCVADPADCPQEKKCPEEEEEDCDPKEEDCKPKKGQRGRNPVVLREQDTDLIGVAVTISNDGAGPYVCIATQTRGSLPNNFDEIIKQLVKEACAEAEEVRKAKGQNTYDPKTPVKHGHARFVKIPMGSSTTDRFGVVAFRSRQGGPREDAAKRAHAKFTTEKIDVDYV